jgi:hypothetical protein
MFYLLSAVGSAVVAYVVTGLQIHRPGVAVGMGAAVPIPRTWQFWALTIVFFSTLLGIRYLVKRYLL